VRGRGLARGVDLEPVRCLTTSRGAGAEGRRVERVGGCGGKTGGQRPDLGKWSLRPVGSRWTSLRYGHFATSAAVAPLAYTGGLEREVAYTQVCGRLVVQALQSNIVIRIPSRVVEHLAPRAGIEDSSSRAALANARDFAPAPHPFPLSRRRREQGWALPRLVRALSMRALPSMIRRFPGVVPEVLFCAGSQLALAADGSTAGRRYRTPRSDDSNLYLAGHSDSVSPLRTRRVLELQAPPTPHCCDIQDDHDSPRYDPSRIAARRSPSSTPQRSGPRKDGCEHTQDRRNALPACHEQYPWKPRRLLHCRSRDPRNVFEMDHQHGQQDNYCDRHYSADRDGGRQPQQ